MLNPFFLQGSKTEQGLIQDLINEQLRMYGVDVYYIPRTYVTEKTVIKEVIQSQFNNAYPIEAYVNSYDGYGGAGTILSKFGIQELDDLNIIISRERFETYITPLISEIPDIELPNRPKEGDLIYFPLGDRLFEIKYVEHEQPFYQLQKNYVYELRCELFRYEDEVIDTSIEQIDDNIKDQGYIQTLSLIGSGTTATAIAGIVNGGVKYINVTNRGDGYTSVPKVAISSAPFGGINAVGIASMIGGLIDCNGTTSLKVQSVQLSNPGAGYTVPPNVVFVGGGGAGAAATAVIDNGIVGIITITSGGSGYSTSPNVTFTSSGIGSTATAYAVVSAAGSITQIRITNAGSGYTSAPTITIESPYSSGSGTYEFNETVVGSISGSTARVNSWNSITNQLQIFVISGSFVSGEIVTGQVTNATYKIKSVTTDNIVDPYAQNDIIQTESNSVIDFSEKNPFGNP